MSINIGKKADFQRAIMEKGFYPENLPPPFSVKHFYDTVVSCALFDEDQLQPKKPVSLARYNDTKRGGQRRIFSTPNPLFFVDVAKYLSKYRKKFSRILKRSDLSCSIPMFDVDFTRALRIAFFAEFTSFRRTQLSTSRYVVKADISGFFHSIYTHSIPWAVHGKSKSKQDRNRYSKTLYANKLDYIIRQSQDQQTVGIPVGPDTSRIFSELIAGAIDKEFKRQVGPHIAGARLVDDMFIGASTLEEAENLLSSYRDAIHQFELDLTDSKTRIFEAKQDLEPFWPIALRREINRFSSSGFGRNQKGALHPISMKSLGQLILSRMME